MTRRTDGSLGAMRLTTAEVAAATGGTVFGPEVTVDGACIDSRLVRGGGLFVALHGARDGHDYVGAALDAGAAAAPGCQRPQRQPWIVVGDAFPALTELATAMRSRLPQRVVGITGSV